MKGRSVRSSSHEGGRSRSRKRPLGKGVVRLLEGAGVGRSGLLRLCVTKLARISHPEAKLCRAVLINNTLRKVQEKEQGVEQEKEEQGMEQTDLRNEEELGETVPLRKLGCAHLEDNEEKGEEEGVEDRMTMCDDIIGGFLAIINSREGGESAGQEMEDQEESSTHCLSKFVSPYSYGSFLSEVYKESMSRILRKVEK